MRAILLRSPRTRKLVNGRLNAVRRPGDISPDIPVIEAAQARGKGYMMALSTLQYKDSYGANVYRAGDLNMPIRMENILNMSPQPDFVQIITWNDGPESHNIGNVWPEQNTDNEPSMYMGSDWDHSAWQPIFSSFIQAWKNGAGKSSMRPTDGSNAVGALWYKTILQDATCPGSGPFSNGSDKYYDVPDNFDTGTDTLNWAIVLSPEAAGSGITAHLAIQVDDVVQSDMGTFNLGAGLNYGSVVGAQAGSPRLELHDGSGNVIMMTNAGQCISNSCPDGIYNMNYQVVGLQSGSDLDTTCL